MPDGAQFDQHLHRLARESLERRATTVDVDAEFGALQARLAGHYAATPPSARHERTRWLAAAAAAVLVVAGIVAIAWQRGGDDNAIVAPAVDTSVTSATPATAPSASTAGTSTTTPATSITAALPAAAAASPGVVAAGEVVTITPASTIQRMCLDIVTMTRVDGDAAGSGGQIVDGAWRAAPGDDVTNVTYPACAGATSGSPVSVVIPVDVPAGEYETCLTEPDDPSGCATVTVTDAISTGTSVPETGSAQLVVGYFGSLTTDAPPYFEIHRFSADGSDVGALADAELAQLFPRYALPDGSTLALEGDPVFGRCGNQPLTRDSGGSPEPLHSELGEARSIGVTSAGVVIAGRDVCPAGTRWGDPGTRWELVALDPAVPASEPEILLTRESDPSQIQFDDGQFVVAMGEMRVDGISPDGRYVALQDLFHIEKWKWHVLDLETPGQLLPIESTCELAGDIVGPPRFVGDDIVVVARLCAQLRAGTASPYEPIGTGDVQVEVIDRTATAPSERIVWHGSVPGLGPHSYTRTVDLSARRADDGTVWALLSAGGGVEEPNRTFAIHGVDATEITRAGYARFVFDPAELFSPWDEPPA